MSIIREAIKPVSFGRFGLCDWHKQVRACAHQMPLRQREKYMQNFSDTLWRSFFFFFFESFFFKFLFYDAMRCDEHEMKQDHKYVDAQMRVE